METTVAEFDQALRRFDDVCLADLLVAAELLTRSDRKYVVDQSVLPELVERLDPSIRALEIDGARTFRYESMYFDTPELVCFREAATMRPNRFKVRTRAYLDSNTCSLEVKARDHRGNTVKERIDHDIDQRGRLTDEGRRFVMGYEYPGRHVDWLVPTLWTVYRRATLLLSVDSRTTIDTGLSFVTPTGRTIDAGTWAVVESKSMGKPTAVDRALWAMGHRPISFSKYAVGMSLLYPDLPAHRWNRPLREAFGWQPGNHPMPPTVRRGSPF
jgi:hypothetical protein